MKWISDFLDFHIDLRALWVWREFSPPFRLSKNGITPGRLVISLFRHTVEIFLLQNRGLPEGNRPALPAQGPGWVWPRFCPNGHSSLGPVTVAPSQFPCPGKGPRLAEQSCCLRPNKQVKISDWYWSYLWLKFWFFLFHNSVLLLLFIIEFFAIIIELLDYWVFWHPLKFCTWGKCLAYLTVVPALENGIKV